MARTKASSMQQFGLESEADHYVPQRDFIAAVETTGIGNTILVIGKETPGGGGWFQVARVALIPAELPQLADLLTRRAAAGEQP